MRRWIPILAAAVVMVGITPRVNAFPMEGDKQPMVMDKMPPGMKMMGRAVYVCKQCKAAYTPAQARKMGYRDPMGHKMTKMAKLPPGVKMMGKTHMGGMMGKAVYVCKECKAAWTPAQARKIGFKCPMGHKMFKVTKLPPGVKMIGKTPMHGMM